MQLEEKQNRIEKLRSQIAECTRCGLHATRTNTVPGEGDVDADVMFIGEAPGSNEDKQGKPFVGRAGGIFERLLESAELTRDQIYLCNILKCRPPNNRNPMTDEIKACVGSLDVQIKTVNPRIIGTLGTFATNYILEKFDLPPAKISAVAGKVLSVDTPFGHKKIVPVFHPAVATYNPTKIDVLLNDFKVFRKLINEEQIA